MTALLFRAPGGGPLVSSPAASALFRTSVLIAGLALSGCVDNLADVTVAKGDVRNAIAKGQMKSPREATVAMTSLQGGTPAMDVRFTQVFAKQAADREITIADAKSAHYLVRGYLSAYASDKGTDVAYVYDIFDASTQHRVSRVNDMITVPGLNPDAWAMVDDRVMESLAGRSADDLAVALAGTPEAQTGSSRTASAATPGKPLN